MDAEKKVQKPTPRPRPISSFIVRVLQIVFCVICLATSSNWAKTWAPYRTSSFQVYLILQSVNLGIFISVSGALLSSFLLFAPRLAPRVADDLPGLVDLILSAIWSVFFLSMGASLASWGACKSSSLCLSWNGTVAMGFLLWVLYSVSAVLAALDLRDQLHALREQAGAAAVPPPAAPLVKKNGSVTHSNGNSKASSLNGSRPSTPPAGDHQV